MTTRKRKTTEPRIISDWELAREIEAQGDDFSMWAEKAEKAEVAENPGTYFSVRFEYEELVLLESGAEAEGLLITEFIRRAALDRARQSAPSDAATSPSR